MVEHINHSIDRIKKARVTIPIALLLVLFILLSAVPIEPVLILLIPIFISQINPSNDVTPKYTILSIEPSIHQQATKTTVGHLFFPSFSLKLSLSSYFTFFLYCIENIKLRRQQHLLSMSMLTLLFCAFLFLHSKLIRNYGTIYCFRESAVLPTVSQL